MYFSTFYEVAYINRRKYSGFLALYYLIFNKRLNVILQEAAYSLSNFIDLEQISVDFEIRHFETGSFLKGNKQQDCCLKYTYPGKEIHLELEVYAFWVNGDLRMKHYVLQIIIQYYQDVAVKLKGYERLIGKTF